MANRRANKDPAKEAHYKAPLTGIGAQSTQELWTEKGTEGAISTYNLSTFFSFAALRGPVTWRNIVFAWFMEFLAACVITIGVGLGRWYVSSDNTIAGLMVAGFSAISFYAATRLPQDDKLPVHGNGLFTIGYIVTGDLGFWGFWLYTSAQYIGCLFSGTLVLGYLLDTLARSLTRNLIPIPLTTGVNATSLTTVALLELFFGAFWLLVVFLKEKLNTETRYDSPEKGRNAKNHSKAMKLGAWTLFWIVLLGWQFGVSTYSNVGYFGPLFGGIHGSPNDMGDIDFQINLDTAQFADSVFGAGGTSGRALMLFGYMPYAAGILGSVLFLMFFFIGKRRGSDPRYADNGPTWPYLHESVGSPSPISVAAAKASMRSPLDPNGSLM
jgi:glycerol uptake facilitator-like aquaporin